MPEIYTLHVQISFKKTRRIELYGELQCYEKSVWLVKPSETYGL